MTVKSSRPFICSCSEDGEAKVWSVCGTRRCGPQPSPQSPDLPSLIFIPVGCRLVPGAGTLPGLAPASGHPGVRRHWIHWCRGCASFMANGQSDMLISNITPHGQIRRTLVFPQDKMRNRNVILIHRRLDFGWRILSLTELYTEN